MKTSESVFLPVTLGLLPILINIWYLSKWLPEVLTQCLHTYAHQYKCIDDIKCIGLWRRCMYTLGGYTKCCVGDNCLRNMNIRSDRMPAYAHQYKCIGSMRRVYTLGGYTECCVWGDNCLWNMNIRYCVVDWSVQSNVPQGWSIRYQEEKNLRLTTPQCHVSRSISSVVHYTCMNCM